MNTFLIDIGFLDRQPVVPMPHKDISDRRSEIQQGKYSGKKFGDENPKCEQKSWLRNMRTVSMAVTISGPSRVVDPADP